MKFTLPSGREIALVSLKLSPTYEGVYEGSIGERMNRAVLSFIEIPKYWDESAIYFDYPEDLTKPLPPVLFIAEFLCYKGITQPHLWSELKYIGLRESVEGKRIEEMMMETLSGLDWETHAREFDFNP